MYNEIDFTHNESIEDDEEQHLIGMYQSDLTSSMSSMSFQFGSDPPPRPYRIIRPSTLSRISRVFNKLPSIENCLLITKNCLHITKNFLPHIIFIIFVFFIFWLISFISSFFSYDNKQIKGYEPPINGFIKYYAAGYPYSINPETGKDYGNSISATFYFSGENCAFDCTNSKYCNSFGIIKTFMGVDCWFYTEHREWLGSMPYASYYMKTNTTI